MQAKISTIWKLPLKIALALFFVGSIAGCHALQEKTIMPSPIPTDIGFVQGVYSRNQSDQTTIEYRGIPYAEAPVGDLRWAMPKTKDAWTGVFNATQFGNDCPQTARFGITDASDTEDCLTLNISLPLDIKHGEKLPVLLWIHGGAFVGGSSNLYRLEKLSHEGRVIVVAPNYRIGFLGFVPLKAFEFDTINGNYGLEDQREAMRWIQRNIHHFGGDPKNVTIAGESAGAASICAHLANPSQANNLFHKAIITSAACTTNLGSIDDGIKIAEEIAGPKFLNCPNASSNISCLRQKAVPEILKAQTDYASDPTKIAPYTPVHGTPAKPNSTLPTSIVDALNNKNGGQFKVVPTMLGSEQKELLLYVAYWWQDALKGKGQPVNNDAIKSFWLPKFYKNNTHLVLRYYDFNNISNHEERLGESLSDFNPQVPLNHCFYYSSANKIKSYPNQQPLYFFEFQDPNALVNGVGISAPYPPFSLGPVHSAILNYLFPNFSNNRKINAPDLPEPSENLAKEIIQYWSSFMREGKPISEKLPQWLAYETSGKNIQKLLPGKIELFNGFNAHNCNFWNSLYPGLDL